VCLLPTPTWSQYFCMVVAAAAMNAVWLVDRCCNDGAARSVLLGLSGLALVYLLMAPHEIERYVRSGRDVPIIKAAEPRGNWQIGHMAAIARRLDAVVAPGEEVATWWPGYLIGSHARVPEGFENFHALLLPLTGAQHQRFHAASAADLGRRLQTHAHRYVLVGNLVKNERIGPKLSAARYERIERFAGTDAELWRSLLAPRE
jgi:hypothetical protein